MARPTKPKDLKPKAEGEAAAPAGAPPSGKAPALDLKFIVLLLAIIISTIGGSVGSMYVLGPMVLVPAIAEKLPGGGEHGEAGGKHAAPAHENKVGINLELDEFMVNLKPDPNAGGNQYLRARMALSIGVPEAENCYAVPEHAQAGEAAIIAWRQSEAEAGQVVGAALPVDRDVDRNIVASGGGAADPVAACLDAFKKNMGKYVPTMRDIINAALMKRTAGTLSTLEGQEALKDEISDEVNAMMDPKYKVLRVNFADFIIQR